MKIYSLTLIDILLLIDIHLLMDNRLLVDIRLLKFIRLLMDIPLYAIGCYRPTTTEGYSIALWIFTYIVA